ncbi:MAG: pyridoxine 5'-phosphate synthase, partial [Candidatus Eutrophobiaceae bacterium]
MARSAAARDSLVLLGVNIDHVATLRQARLTPYPNLLDAANIAIKAGADYITLHLREDRRHIQDNDAIALIDGASHSINLELAATREMLDFTERHPPQYCCLVPERREELTTEGGLNVTGQAQQVGEACKRLSTLGCRVSLFIEPAEEQIQAAAELGAHCIELHTGQYAGASSLSERNALLKQIAKAALLGQKLGMQVHAGHGLHYENTAAIAAIPEISELNIGHAIIAHALFTGLHQAVVEMKALMVQ